MKKSIFKVLVVLVVAVMAMAVIANAEAKNPLIFEQGAGTFTADGGKFYAKDAHMVAADEDKSTNGVTIAVSAAADAHCLWADYQPSVKVAGLRYLHYTLSETAAANVIRIGVGYNVGWDASKVVEFPIEAGEHIIDLTQNPDYNADTYIYIEVAQKAGTELIIDNFYLSDSDATDYPVEEDPTPATADIFSVAAIITVAAAAAVVLAKKH